MAEQGSSKLPLAHHSIGRVLDMFFRALVFLLVSSIAHAEEPAWFLFARHDGCTDLEIVARKMKLPRTPTSPEDFAQMMQDRGNDVVVGPSPWFPPNLPGRIVQVQFGPESTVAFLSAETCRALAGAKK